jgi:hypothetical protein
MDDADIFAVHCTECVSVAERGLFHQPQGSTARSGPHEERHDFTNLNAGCIALNRLEITRTYRNEAFQIDGFIGTR